MAVVRRFLIASSLTRLIRKERGSEQVVEGHFAPQSERQSHVRIERGQAHLVLTSLDGDVTAAEDWTDVPRSHAEALLQVCPGTVTFERSRLGLPQQEALIDRFMTPGPLDLVSVEFSTQADADAFMPPVWFGSEVTADDSYTNRMIAIVGRPRAPEAPLSNAALETALDLLESGPEEALFVPYERDAEPAVEEDSPFDRLRRLAAVRPASSLPVATPLVAAPLSEAVADRADVGQEPQQRPAEGVARLRPRRPTVHIASSPASSPAPSPEEDGDDRLAGVIQGLSEALSQAGVEKDERFGA